MVERRFVIGGNWKMNGNVELINQLCTQTLKNLPSDIHNRGDIIIAPQFTHLNILRQKVEEEGLSSSIQVAAQNMASKESGAYTGEVSFAALTDLNINWVILGHSERRHLFGETNDIVGEKVKLALEKSNLKVILCVGEQLKEREEGLTADILKSQLSSALLPLKQLNLAIQERLVIAYEPVWAIGTGLVASTEQAQEAHCIIRGWIRENIDQMTVQKIRIIYGGSVSAGNCNALAMLPDIDGFLVGGASLKPEFRDIALSLL